MLRYSRVLPQLEFNKFIFESNLILSWLRLKRKKVDNSCLNIYRNTRNKFISFYFFLIFTKAEKYFFLCSQISAFWWLRMSAVKFMTIMRIVDRFLCPSTHNLSIRDECCITIPLNPTPRKRTQGQNMFWCRTVNIRERFNF